MYPTRFHAQIADVGSAYGPDSIICICIRYLNRIGIVFAFTLHERLIEDFMLYF